MSLLFSTALKAHPEPSTPQQIFSTAQPTTFQIMPSLKTTVVNQTHAPTLSASTNGIAAKSPTQNTPLTSPAQNMTSKSPSQAVTTTQQATDLNSTPHTTLVEGAALHSTAESTAAMATENSHGLIQGNFQHLYALHFLLYIYIII